MKPLLLLCALVLLGGCHSGRIETPEKPDRSVILLTPQQAKHHGLVSAGRETDALPTHPNLTSAVVAAPEVKVYSVGRTIDGGDPGLMHEAHVVYRQETSPRWRLHAPADQRILVGPQLTDGRQENQPLLTKELTAYLNEQRHASQANERAIAALFQAVERLAEQQRTLAERGGSAELPERGPDADSGAGARPEPAPSEKKVNGD